MRAIEQPIRYMNAFSSLSNAIELKRRIRARWRPESNWRNKLTVDAIQFRDYFKFTIVRNPWSRALSLYNNILRDPTHQQVLRVPPETPFREFLLAHAGRGMLQPQTYWLRSFEGAIPMDFIGRFENIRGDFRRACDMAGIDVPDLPHEIRGSSEEYQKHYDAPSRKLVEQVYRQEIELFGYSFDV